MPCKLNGSFVSSTASSTSPGLGVSRLSCSPSQMESPASSRPLHTTSTSTLALSGVLLSMAGSLFTCTGQRICLAGRSLLFLLSPYRTLPTHTISLVLFLTTLLPGTLLLHHIFFSPLP